MALVLTYSHQWQTRVFPELLCLCERRKIKLPESSVCRPLLAFCLRLFSTVAQGLFLCIEAVVNHLHCSRRSSGGWWMFTASERAFGSFNLNTVVVFFVWGLEIPWSVFPSTEALIFQLDLCCPVIGMTYVMCSTPYPGDVAHFSNDSIDSMAQYYFLIS